MNINRIKNTIIFKGIFGSRLYGTYDENSDTDIKGVFLPNLRSLVIAKYTDSYTIDGANDEQMLSIHKFFNLLKKGEMTAMDMIHVPEEFSLVNSNEWKNIRDMRSMFYTKNMSGYLGYIKAQTAKYSDKGNRLQICKEVYDFLKNSNGTKKLETVFNELPIIEGYTTVYMSQNPAHGRIYEICGKKLTEFTAIDYCAGILKAYIDNYGARAIAAKDNKGIDWKAVSHAFRTCYQVQEIVDENDITFPLKQREFLKKIKYGQLDFGKNKIGEKLNDLVEETVYKLNNSNLPDKLSSLQETYLDNIIYEMIMNHGF